MPLPVPSYMHAEISNLLSHGVEEWRRRTLARVKLTRHAVQLLPAPTIPTPVGSCDESPGCQCKSVSSCPSKSYHLKPYQVQGQWLTYQLLTHNSLTQELPSKRDIFHNYFFLAAAQGHSSLAKVGVCGLLAWQFTMIRIAIWIT